MRKLFKLIKLLIFKNVLSINNTTLKFELFILKKKTIVYVIKLMAGSQWAKETT